MWLLHGSYSDHRTSEVFPREEGGYQNHFGVSGGWFAAVWHTFGKGQRRCGWGRGCLLSKLAGVGVELHQPWFYLEYGAYLGVPEPERSRFAVPFREYYWVGAHAFFFIPIKISHFGRRTSDLEIYHNATWMYFCFNVVEQPGKEIGDPHFECFMVSDQLQAFHKHGLIYEKETHDNYFDLITTKSESTSEMPTFLRGGMETARFFFKEVLVWVPIVLLRFKLFPRKTFSMRGLIFLTLFSHWIVPVLRTWKRWWIYRWTL